ncbi:GmrSD restriction endonuclease domain-containing protein [Micrococcus terreus]|uniref:GmrSD restriction endonuclease domain-containing protein n=1 Tax=Micrococcus terreus TaxID=574650 RepID=UPI003D74FBE6
MQKSDYPIRQLVDMVESGDLRLPEMQRGYVWRATRVRDLMDSLYRGYPSGVILAWETDEDIETRDFAVESRRTPTRRPLLLLDGQQRLTSLAAVLRGKPVHVRERKTPIELLFNLDHPEQLTFVHDVDEASDEDAVEGDETKADIQQRQEAMTFVVSSRALAAKANWVPVGDIFTQSDGPLLKRAGVTSMDDERYDKYTERLQRVRAIAEYQYRMDTLESSKSYEEVTEIFVRVNSLGAKLRSSDLALAQITARWRGSLQQFLKFQNVVDQRGFRLDLSLYLRTLVALTTGQAKFQTVHTISLDDLRSGWERTQKAIHFSLNLLETNLGIDSPVLLSSPSLLVTTAYWADQNNFHLTAAETAAFQRWLLLANAKGRYSRGSMETLLDQDLAVVRSGQGSEGLLRRLRSQVGRLDFTAEELEGKTSRSGAFKTMFLAFRNDGASDWASGLVISSKHSGNADRIEFHHVFPKAYLRRERPGIDPKSINDIANLAFIGSTTNKQIGAHAPAQYSGTFDPQRLSQQLVDFSTGGEADGFEAFVHARRALIAGRLNEFLGTESQTSASSDLADP